jgi:hypothetical protein
MGLNRFNRAVLSVGGEDREFVVPTLTIDPRAMLEELQFVWREAQAEAVIAYRAWRAEASGDAYTVYRAAQDRADAAQDLLAEHVRRTAAAPA